MFTPNLQSEGARRFSSGLDQTVSGVDIVPVTPSNTVDLPTAARAIRARVAGDLRITTYKGVVRNTYIAAGEVLPVVAIRVHATGTTATGIEALI